MKLWGTVIAVLAACVVSGAEIGEGAAAGKNVAIEATLRTDEKDIVALLGRVLEPGVAVAEVTVTPTSDAPVKIWRADFFLRSDKDGQRSEPYDPSQLAGDSVLIVSRQSGGGGLASQGNGPVWGDPRSPRRLPTGSGGAGSTTTSDERNQARLAADAEPENELLDLLRERVLEEEEISEPVAGLLFFLLEGNHKTRQLWLHYRGGGEKIDIQFQPRKK